MNTSTPTPTETGTVSWYSAEKGFGFITPEAGGRDVVVYAETLKDAGFSGLKPGDRLRFTTEPYRLARKAVAIERTTT